jgi:hypothetical protein
MFRSSRKAPRHGRDEESVTEAIAPVPDPDWAAIPVPAAQIAAGRAASGPQLVLPAGVPPGAVPPEDVPQFSPRGAHPYAHPVQQPRPQRPVRRPVGMQHTAAWAPPFDEHGERPRPYAPRNRRERQPEDPAELWYYQACGEWQFTPPGEQAEAAMEAWHQLCALAYPGRDMHATFRDYGALMARVSEITGTTGTGIWPLQALPAADERHARLADVVAGHVRAFEDTDPAKAGAYRRLHEAVLAAPDYRTALRLADVADEAGIAGYLDLPAMTAGQNGAAA